MAEHDWRAIAARTASHEALVAAIRDELLATGRMPFARFMELALYHPRYGYYLAPESRPGRGGDFLTAPELSPFFGRCLARQLRELWEHLGAPTPFTVLEYGAGGGRLAHDILVGARAEASDFARALRYILHEANAYRRADATRLLHEAGFGDQIVLEDPAGPARPTEPITGCVLANEFVDALPVHRVVWREGTLLERYVRWVGEWFAEELAAPSTPRLAAALAAGGVTLAEGQQAEVSLAAADWLATAANRLARGAVLTIDYGYPTADLYAPRRREGTLLCYYQHTANDEPYQRVGYQDMTAHVDFGALERAGAARGLAPLGLARQAYFLTDLGLGDLLVATQTPDRRLEDYLADRTAVLALIDPGGMGGFRVLAQGREVELVTPLRGFTSELLGAVRAGAGANRQDAKDAKGDAN